MKTGLSKPFKSINMEEVNRLIQLYKDDDAGKLELVNSLRSLSRKEKNDTSFGILIRYFLDNIEL